MLLSLYHALTHLLPALEGFVALVAAWRYRHLAPPLRWLAYLAWASVGMEITIHFVRDANGSNWFLGPIDRAIEFTLLALLYRKALAPSALSRAVPALVVGFGLLSAYTFWQGLGVVRFSTLQSVVEGILVLGLVMVYFRQLMETLTVLYLEREPLFWVSAGLLVYFAGSLLVRGASNFALQQSRPMLLQLSVIRLVLYALLNLCYLVALWVRPVPLRQPTRPAATW